MTRELRKQENVELRQRLLPFLENQAVDCSEPAIVSLYSQQSAPAVACNGKVWTIDSAICTATGTIGDCWP